MNQEVLITLIDTPGELSFKSITYLENIIRKYPYFQTAYLLYAKNLKIENSIRYENQLKIAAAHVVSRKKLYYLINDITEFEDQTDILTEAEEEKIIEVTPVKTIEEKPQESEVQIPEKKVPEPVDERFEDKQAEIKKQELIDQVNKRLEEIKQEKQQNDILKEVPVKQELKPESPAISEDPKKVAEKQQTVDELIENFIKKQPTISRPTTMISKHIIDDSETIKKSARSVEDTDDFISETLAKIYIKQGNLRKAINIYEKLKLKIPEKSVYFADQIEKTKKLLN